MNESLFDSLLRKHRNRSNPLKVGVLQKDDDGHNKIQINCVEGKRGEPLPQTINSAVKVATRFVGDGKLAWVQRLRPETDAFKNTE